MTLWLLIVGLRDRKAQRAAGSKTDNARLAILKAALCIYVCVQNNHGILRLEQPESQEIQSDPDLESQPLNNAEALRISSASQSAPAHPGTTLNS